jgi:hypothetical protein
MAMFYPIFTSGVTGWERLLITPAQAFTQS